eukprot:2661207-Pyramimonas_sp.AAC.1
MPKDIGCRAPEDSMTPRSNYEYLNLADISQCIQTYQNVYGIVLDCTGRLQCGNGDGERGTIGGIRYVIAIAIAC